MSDASAVENVLGATRITSLRERLTTEGLDGLLVTDPHNRRYLSGFSGSAGMLLVTSDRAALATDFRYWEQAASQTHDIEIFKQEGSLSAWLPELLAGLGGKRIGYEAGYVSVALHKQLREAIAGMPTGDRVSLVQSEGLVEGLRAVKDEAEKQALERAVRLGDEAFAAVSILVEPGWTEQRVAWEIERYAREHGAEGLSFPTIVGGGPWSAMPHAYPRDEPLREGEPIVIDMGVIVAGYCSDMTRTIVLGKPDAQFGAVYEIVLMAQETAEATIEAGMTGEAAHMIAQAIIAEAGHGERFGHGLGHGVGLEVHEHPRVSSTSEDVIEEGMVITIEPGIYIPGWGGVRIEDQGVIEDGKLRVFTQAPKLRMVGV